MPEPTQRFLCIATFEKGHDFMLQCAELGVKPSLVTVEKLRDAAWPREILEDIHVMPNEHTLVDTIKSVCWMCRGRQFDRIIALDEFDLDAAAKIREHTRIPGMGVTSTAYYRDRLAMLTGASESGYLVPEFCRILNYDELRAFMASVPGPWILKPRADSWSIGTRKIYDPEQLWRTLDELGDLQTNYLLEQYLSGDIFHVDAIMSSNRVMFSVVHQYGEPPSQGSQDRSVFTMRMVDRTSREWKDLTVMNARLAPDLGMARGVTHAEYVRSHGNGRFYFLEIGARVGGAFTADLIETATGINLWREWAKVEIADLRGEPYALSRFRESYAGSVLCLVNNGEVDTSSFNAPEIVLRVNKHHLAGLIVRSDDPSRVRELLHEYSAELVQRGKTSVQR
jgi:biotin carboxylase